MPSGRPWYPAYPADFFTATQGWDLEMKGPYRLFIDLLNERDRPVPDEPKFIAGILGCSVQRWKKVRQFLLDEGKLVPTADGLHLTNPRFEREHVKRTLDLVAAEENGRAGGRASAARRAGQQDFDLDPEASRAHGTPARHARTEEPKSSKKIGKKIEKTSEKPASHSEITETEPAQINDLDQPPPQAPRAGVRDQSPEIREEDSSHPNGSAPRAHAREEPAAGTDLERLFNAVCAAAGFRPVQPAAIDLAFSKIEEWRDAGIDFDEVVIPSIRAEVLASDVPTRTLGRFSRRVQHEQARFKAAALTAKPYVKPEIPHLNPAGEDPVFLPIRTDLLERCGDRAYCHAFNHVRFEDIGPVGDKHPLRVAGPDYLIGELRNGRWRSIIAGIAQPYGFTEVW